MPSREVLCPQWRLAGAPSSLSLASNQALFPATLGHLAKCCRVCTEPTILPAWRNVTCRDSSQHVTGEKPHPGRQSAGRRRPALLPSAATPFLALMTLHNEKKEKEKKKPAGIKCKYLQCGCLLVFFALSGSIWRKIHGIGFIYCGIARLISTVESCFMQNVNTYPKKIKRQRCHFFFIFQSVPPNHCPVKAQHEELTCWANQELVGPMTEAIRMIFFI